MTMMEINWTKGSGSEVANYYFEGADYYLENGVEAKWHGKYHELLGLTGRVTQADLKAVLNNRNPLGGKITQRDVAGRRTGLEIVFSAPKSLSIMDAIAGDARVRKAFDDTVHRTMLKIEKGAKRRVRAGGQDTNVTTGNIVYAAFPHKLGRPVNGVPDPQMHTHVRLANCTYDENTGKWYALEAGQIVKDAPYYQAFFRMELAKQLEGLGYKLDYSKGNFEIHGITKEMRDKFSNRTKQVEEAITAYGFTRDESKAKVGALTREKKNNNHTWEQLQQIWADRLTQSELSQVRDIYAKALGYGVRDAPDFSAKYVEKALDELTHKKTWTTERQVYTHAMKEGLGKVSKEGMESHMKLLEERGHTIKRRTPREELTTPKAKMKQVEVMDLWKRGMGACEKMGRDTYTVKAPAHLKILKKLVNLRDRFGSVRMNIKRKESMASAKGATGGGEVKDVNNPPDTPVWFVSNIPDGDLPDLMKKAEEQDRRIVFWGQLTPSALEEKLKLDPIQPIDKPVPKKKQSKRLKQIINLLRGQDDREKREMEPARENRDRG